MDPHGVFCPNPECPARGRSDQGTIGVHSLKEKRYHCRVCDTTFSATKGTPFYRARSSPEVMTTVLTLLAHGCPIPAIVAAFALDERTIRRWLRNAGTHCQALHEHLLKRPLPLGQVQADEIRVRTQGGVVWMALALMVRTRFWLGGVISPRRDTALITRLIGLVRAAASALAGPILFCTDGLGSYAAAIRAVFREAVPRGGRGRRRLRPWDGILIAQVVKQDARGHVVGVLRRIVQGTAAEVERVIRQSQGCGVINTAYIERLNATFRQRLAALVRRGRGLARQSGSLERGMYLVGTVYNF